MVKAGSLLLKRLTNTCTLKIRIFSEPSILYLIHYASVILIVGLRQLRRMPTIVGRKISGSNQQSLDHWSNALPTELCPWIRSTGFNLANKGSGFILHVAAPYQ